jgi:PST family polysaccharide transporter/lipopolysaccharide exporter
MRELLLADTLLRALLRLMSEKRLTELVKRLTPTGSSGSQVVKSLAWIGTQNAVNRGILLLMLIVLARLIGPEELGLVGIALLTLSGLKKFTNIGLNSALIQHEDEYVDGYLDTVWLLEIGRGVIVAGGMVLASPVIASLFGEPRAELLLQVIAISPILFSLKNPGVVYFDKHLDFHKEFVYQLGGTVIRAVISIGYALVEPTAWAFVAGFLSADAAKFVLSYVIDDYRPWFNFDREAAEELIDYGKWMTGSSILLFLNTEGDDAFVGWLLGPAALGFYQYAYRLSNAPATEVTQMISRVMFPAFSKLQNNTQRLRYAFLNTLRMTSFVSFPAAFGIAAVAPTFVRAFLGPEWTEMILAMQILAAYGLLRSINKTFGPVWKATGRPDILAKLGALRLILIVGLIYPLTTRFGIAGTALTVTVIYVFPMMPIGIFVLKRSIETTYRQLLYEFAYPLIASVVMFSGVWFVYLNLDIAPILKFGVLVATGIVLYVASVFVIEVQFDWGIRQNITTVVSNIKS